MKTKVLKFHNNQKQQQTQHRCNTYDAVISDVVSSTVFATSKKHLAMISTKQQQQQQQQKQRPPKLKETKTSTVTCSTGDDKKGKGG